MIYRLAQALLGYSFTVIYCLNKMMLDTDYFMRLCGLLIVKHCMIAWIVSNRDRSRRPFAYNNSALVTSPTEQITQHFVDPFITTYFNRHSHLHVYHEPRWRDIEWSCHNDFVKPYTVYYIRNLAFYI